MKTFPVDPLFSKVVITLNTEEVKEGEIQLNQSIMSEIQFVIAAGEMVRSVEPGQMVLMDLEKLTVQERVDSDTDQTRGRIKIDPLTVNGVTYAIVEDRFIKAKFKN